MKTRVLRHICINKIRTAYDNVRYKFTVIHDDTQLCLKHNYTLMFFGYGPLPVESLPRVTTTFDNSDQLLSYLQNHSAPELTQHVLKRKERLNV